MQTYHTGPNDLNKETALQVDPRTGFLESPRIDRVSAEIKAKFVEVYKECGDFSLAASRVGHYPRVFRRERNTDPVFSAEFMKACDAMNDRMEGVTYQVGLTPRGVIDRRAWLNAKRPEVWNPSQQQPVHINVQVTERLATQAHQFVDTTATAVTPTTGRRADDTTVGKVSP